MRRHQFALGPDASQNYAIAEVYRSKVSDGAPAGTNSYSQPRIQQGTGPVIVLMTIAEQLAAVVDAEDRAIEVAGNRYVRQGDHPARRAGLPNTGIFRTASIGRPSTSRNGTSLGMTARYQRLEQPCVALSACFTHF